MGEGIHNTSLCPVTTLLYCTHTSEKTWTLTIRYLHIYDLQRAPTLHCYTVPAYHTRPGPCHYTAIPYPHIREDLDPNYTVPTHILYLHIIHDLGPVTTLLYSTQTSEKTWAPTLHCYTVPTYPRGPGPPTLHCYNDNENMTMTMTMKILTYPRGPGPCHYTAMLYPYVIEDLGPDTTLLCCTHMSYRTWALTLHCYTVPTYHR